MKEGDAEILKQLNGFLDKTIEKLEIHHQEGDTENFSRAKALINKIIDRMEDFSYE